MLEISVMMSLWLKLILSLEQKGWFGKMLGLIYNNASATASVISRRWNDDNEMFYWWRKPE